MAKETPSFGWAFTSITSRLQNVLGSVACDLHSCLWQKLIPCRCVVISFTQLCTTSQCCISLLNRHVLQAPSSL